MVFFLIYIYTYTHTHTHTHCPNVSRGQELFIFSITLRQAVGPTQPPIQRAMGPGHESMECT